MGEFPLEVICFRLALERATRLCIYMRRLALTNARWKSIPKRHYKMMIMLLFQELRRYKISKVTDIEFMK